jgi:phosphonate transport system substrate-binding protein
MMSGRKPFQFLAVLLLAFAGAAAGATPGVLVLGRVSDDPQRHHGQLQPLLDYVVPRMADVGIREGRILIARDISRMTSYLRHGRVDWVTETVASASGLIDRAGARPLLFTHREGVARYRSVLVVRTDSPLRSPADLVDHRLALQSPRSTSAYLLPAMTLLDAGLPMEILPTPADRPRPGNVGYVFANTEDNIAHWVVLGVVDAGAFSGQDLEEWRAERPDAPALRVIGASRYVPRAMELVRGDLDPRVAARLREVLLAAATDPQAAPALRAFFDTTGFEVPDAAALADLAALGERIRHTREAIE